MNDKTPLHLLTECEDSSQRRFLVIGYNTPHFLGYCLIKITAYSQNEAITEG